MGSGVRQLPQCRQKLSTQTCSAILVTLAKKGKRLKNTKSKGSTVATRKRDIRQLTDHDIKEIKRTASNNTPRNLGMEDTCGGLQRNMVGEMGRSPYPQK